MDLVGRYIVVEVLRDMDTRDYDKLFEETIRRGPGTWEFRSFVERDPVICSALIAEDKYVSLIALPCLKRILQIKEKFYEVLKLFCRLVPRGKRVTQVFSDGKKFRFPSIKAWLAFMFHPKMTCLWIILDDSPMTTIPVPLLRLTN